MIDDVDQTLAGLLKRDLPPRLAEHVAISFAAPDGQFPPAGVKTPAVDLFLYDIRENRELRDPGWVVERDAGTATARRPPLRIDCSYLITAWPGKESNSPSADEHHLLGEVMKVLARHSTLPADVLHGSLQGQAPPLPTSVLQPGRLASVGEFWQAMGGKPKAALHYTVTVSVALGESRALGPVVRDVQITLTQGVGTAHPSGAAH